MIRLGEIIGTIVVVVFLTGSGIYGLRTQALLRPPSDVTRTMAHILMEHPDEWRLGGDENVLYNDTRGLVIQRFGEDGSIKVTRHGELVPTLDQSMNFLPNHNQNYLNAAMRDWMEKTKAQREARMIEQIKYGG